jgi:hypothetical protein
MSEGTKFLILVVLVAGLGVLGYETLWPKPDARAAALEELASCPNGTVACPNHCLKREDEGWTSMHVDGHPDTDVWMKFVNADGKSVAYNQRHVGHVIELVNGVYTDTGVCPMCRGTTRVCK